MGSLPYGVASTMSYDVSLLSNMQKPSWCLLVTVRYFIPAALASLTHSSASNFTGLNRGGSFSYSEIGILSLFITHTPLPRSEYTPQWTNMPNFGSSNQRARALGSASRSGLVTSWAA